MTLLSSCLVFEEVVAAREETFQALCLLRQAELLGILGELLKLFNSDIELLDPCNQLEHLVLTRSQRNAEGRLAFPLGEDHLQQPSGNKAGAKATRAAAGSVTLEDCQFHQCVKLGKFDADRIISFVPPDGDFELMRYRATENVNLPFKVHAIVNEVGKTKVEYSIAIRANYGSKLFATNVVVRIPTPLNTARITERTSQGKAKYEPEHNNIVWKIPRFTGQSEFVLSAEASLTSMTNQKAWSRPPLNLSFSLLMFTSSGLLVRYLKVFEKSNYSSVKWVRYMTRAGNYEIR